MSAATGLMRMAKPKGRPKTSNRDDASVKIDRIIINKAKMVATHKGTSVAELLSEILRTPIDRAYASMLRELEGDEKGEGRS